MSAKRPSNKKPQKVQTLTRLMDNLVIGLTGPIGSGCSSLAKVLGAPPHNFAVYRISDWIEKELGIKRTGKRPKDWRKRLQDHGNKRRQKNVGYWAEKVIAKIGKDAKTLGKKPIVIDGVRN